MHNRIFLKHEKCVTCTRTLAPSWPQEPPEKGGARVGGWRPPHLRPVRLRASALPWRRSAAHPPGRGPTQGSPKLCSCSPRQLAARTWLPEKIISRKGMISPWMVSRNRNRAHGETCWGRSCPRGGAAAPYAVSRGPLVHPHLLHLPRGSTPALGGPTEGPRPPRR